MLLLLDLAIHLIRRRHDLPGVRELPDHMRRDIGLPPREASPRPGWLEHAR